MIDFLWEAFEVGKILAGAVLIVTGFALLTAAVVVGGLALGVWITS